MAFLKFDMKDFSCVIENRLIVHLRMRKLMNITLTRYLDLKNL